MDVLRVEKSKKCLEMPLMEMMRSKRKNFPLKLLFLLIIRYYILLKHAS